MECEKICLAPRTALSAEEHPVCTRCAGPRDTGVY